MSGSQHRIEVAPGRYIGWETRGTGPGLVLLHGAGTARQDLRPLAAALKDRFTLHLVDRNGRGLSLPRDDAGGLAGQARDIAAVLGETGARYLFGHSAGGMVALATAAVAPLEKLVVYEPGISVDGSFHRRPTGREVIARVERGDYAGGMIGLARAVGALPGWMPEAPLRGLLSLALALGGGRHLRELLPLVRPDLEQSAADDGPASRFASLGLPVLVMWGSRSPEFLRDVAQQLVAALPAGQGSELAGQGHIAPDFTAPQRVAGEIERFLLG